MISEGELVPRPDEHLDRLMGRVLARRIRVGYFVIKEVLGIIKPVEVRDYARLREVKAEESEERGGS